MIHNIYAMISDESVVLQELFAIITFFVFKEPIAGFSVP